MSESDRRYQRYFISEGAFKSQRIKGSSFIGTLKGWMDCQIRDLSYAGAQVYSNAKLGLGAKIEIKLTSDQGKEMNFKGEVVNIGRDLATSQQKLGVRIEEPAVGSKEANFLGDLSENFEKSF
tara:strand:+ start:12076 stop:12444 length:369 start_codon:yes stop_codon:yes gene_type:complete